METLCYDMIFEIMTELDEQDLFNYCVAMDDNEIYKRGIHILFKIRYDDYETMEKKIDIIFGTKMYLEQKLDFLRYTDKRHDIIILCTRLERIRIIRKKQRKKLKN